MTMNYCYISYFTVCFVVCTLSGCFPFTLAELNANVRVDYGKNNISVYAIDSLDLNESEECEIVGVYSNIYEAKNSLDNIVQVRYYIEDITDSVNVYFYENMISVSYIRKSWFMMNARYIITHGYVIVFDDKSYIIMGSSSCDIYIE